MRFQEAMPSYIEEKFKRILQRDETVTISVSTDLAEDRTYGERWMVVTDRRVLIFSPDGRNGTVELPLKEITEAKTEPLVGGGRLELSVKGKQTEHLYYSCSLKEKFSEVTRGIQQLSRGEPLRLSEEEDRTRCDKCGRLLPERNGICPACVKKWQVFARLCRHLKPHTGKAAGVVAVSLVSTAAELMPPKLSQWIIDDALKQANARLLLLLVLGLGGVRLLTWGAEMIHGWLVAWLGTRVVADIRADVFRQLELLSLQFYDKKQIGALMSRVTNDTRTLKYFLVDGLPYIVLRCLLFFGIVGMLFHLNWVLTLYLMIPVPFIVMWNGLLWKRLRGYYRKWWRLWAQFSARIEESLSGIRVVKAFTQEEREINRFDEKSVDLFKIGYFTERKWALFSSTAGLIAGVGTLIIWTVGGKQVLGEELTLGQLWAFYSYSWLFYGPLRWLTQLNSWVTRAFSGAERIFEIIDTKPEGYENPKAIPLPNMKGQVTFEDVTFGYDKSKPVLKNIDLDVKPGEMIGLVGKSGAGKTTTINLICRFYDVDSGSLKIDGMEVKDIKLEDLRKQIGVVLQEPFLFNGTIAENISYGRPDATFEEVIQAAEAANAHNFIVAKPDGYDTQVGERGGRLSVGEKQRISIARAILHNPRILILDEATSSVDTETEQQIQEAIKRLIKGRTTFAIAHRLSTLRYADRLVILEDGKVAEVGSHEELMAKGGVFDRLVKLQSQTSQIIGIKE